jgi:hypothetical protein
MAMNAIKTLMLTGLAIAAISQAHGAEAFAATHNPGGVVDEVVVTARAPSSQPIEDALAEISAALEAQIKEIVAAAQEHPSYVTKISSNGRILFARWRI